MRESSKKDPLVEFHKDISNHKSSDLLTRAITELERLPLEIKVSKGGHSIDQIVQRLYGVKRALDKQGLGGFTYIQLKNAEREILSIALVTVLIEASQITPKVYK